MWISKKQRAVDYFLSFSVKVFLFFLPWQTVWIQREIFVDGVKWQHATLQFFLSEALLWLSIVFFMFWYLKEMKKKESTISLDFSPDRFFVFSVFLFLVYAFMSAFWAKDSDIAFQQSLRLLASFLFFMAVFFSSFDFKSLLRWLMYGSFLPALLGLAQFLFQTTWGSSLLGLTEHLASEPGTSILSADLVGRWLRAYGSFGHPNTFGFYLFLSLMASTLLYVNSKKSLLANSLLFSVVSLQIMALFFTFSRSAWLAFVLWLFVLYFHRFFNFNIESVRAKMLCFASLSFVLLLLWSAFPLVRVRFGFNAPHEIQSIEERLSEYEQAKLLFFQKSVLGQGAGNYTQALYVSLNKDEISHIEAWRLQPAHNVLLLALVEFGLLGFGLASIACLSYLFFLRSSDPSSKRIYFKKLLIFAPPLPFLLLDHQVLSLYPGTILLVLYIGIATRLFLSKPILS
ncbi:MAG: O-antigen ligase family protein [Candidatus Magasanikbacteria bacterium]|nr:O-antigen ligase family protein [Candidatus Magasanikbacteria bacterium]